MAKQYVSLTVRGFDCERVEAEVAKIAGVGVTAWRESGFMGTHLDCIDVTDAECYGAAFHGREADGGRPVVDVDIFAQSHRALGSLLIALADTLGRGLSAALATEVVLSTDSESGPQRRYSCGKEQSMNE